MKIWLDAHQYELAAFHRVALDMTKEEAETLTTEMRKWLTNYPEGNNYIFTLPINRVENLDEK